MRFHWFHVPTAFVAGSLFAGIAFWQEYCFDREKVATGNEPTRSPVAVERMSAAPKPLTEAIEDALRVIPPSRPGPFGERSATQFMMSWVSSQSDERLWELAEMEPSEDVEDVHLVQRLIGLARTNLSLRHPDKAIESFDSGSKNNFQALEAWAARDSQAALRWLDGHEAMVKRPKVAYRSVWAGLARNDLKAALTLAEERDDLPRAMTVIARSIQSEAQAAMALKQFFPHAMKLHAEEDSRARSGPRDLHVTEILRSMVMRPLLTAEESIRLIDTHVPEACRDDLAANFFSHQFPHSSPELLDWLDERSRLGGDTDWIRRAFGSIDREHLDTAVSLVQSRQEAAWHDVAMSSLNRRLKRIKR